MSINRRVLSLKNAIVDKDVSTAVDIMKQYRPIDIADALGQLKPTSACKILAQLPNQSIVFAYSALSTQVEIASILPETSLITLIGGMPADARTDLYKQLDTEHKDILMPALAQAKREDIRRLAQYEEETAGALMTSDYVTLTRDKTIAEALEIIRLEAPDAETIYHVYVIDADRKLLGVVSLKSLILANPQQLVQEVTTTDIVFSYVGDDQEDVAKMISRYDLIALPVVDTNEALVGIVTHDDATDVMSREATEDFHKSGGVGTMVGRFKETSIKTLYKNRVFWLVFLVFGNLISGIGIAHYEDIIAANIVLVFFLPLLVDSGGNAGSQSATLMVRALATGDVQMRDWFSLLGREALVALLLGATMAVAISIIGLYRGDAAVSLVLALSMMSVVMIGCVVGMSLPFVLSKFGFDPASASAPLITSVCDATGVIIYLFIAAQILGL